MSGGAQADRALNKVDISVIIPIYNAETYLPTCLDSVIEQSLPAGKKIEILAVNDGSTDGSADILANYQRKYACLQVIEQPNQGQSVARNKGIQAAVGDYLMFADSDDYLAPDTFVKCLKMATETRADILYFDCQHTDKQGVRGEVFSNYQPGILAGEVFRPVDHPQVLRALPSPCSKFYKRSFIQEKGLFFKPGIWFEDLHFYLQLILQNPRMVYLPLPLYLYRQHGTSITKSFADERNRAIITVFEDILALYQQHKDYEHYRAELDFLGLEHIYTGILYIASKGRNKDLYRDVKRYYKANFPLVDGAEHRLNRYRLPRNKRLIATLADLHLLWLAGVPASHRKL